MSQEMNGVIPSTVPNNFTVNSITLTAASTYTYDGEGVMKGFSIQQTTVPSASVDVKVDPVDSISLAILMESRGKRVFTYNQNFNLTVANTSSLGRNDLIVLKYTMNPTIAKCEVDIILGTPSATPIDPTLPGDDGINFSYLIIGAIRRAANRNDVINSEIIISGNTTNGSGQALRSIPSFVYTAGSPTNGLLISNGSGIAANSGKLITNVAFKNENNFFTEAQTSSPQALSIISGSVSWDLKESNCFTLTLNSNVVFNNPADHQVGRGGSIFVAQDSTGNRKINWGTVIPATINQNVLSIFWTVGNTLRITFDNAGIDLSALIIGQSVAYISGSTNAVNNSPANQGFAVTNFDNSAKWIEITNPNISSNATDEPSSPAILTIANSIFSFVDGIPVQPSQAPNSESIISFICTPTAKIFVTATPGFKLA